MSNQIASDKEPNRSIGESTRNELMAASRKHFGRNWKEFLSVWFMIVRWRIRQYVILDSKLFRWLIVRLSGVASSVLWWAGKDESAFRLDSFVHRGAFSALRERKIEARLKRMKGQSVGLWSRHIHGVLAKYPEGSPLREPTRLLSTRIMVVKSPDGGERGAIIVDYSYVFPIVARCFDIEQIAQRYHIIIEPSWSGYCDADILCYMRYDFPVFVQAVEPRDLDLLARLSSNLIPVEIAANWWIDHRVFRPLADVQKDADIFFNAAWAAFKRHYLLFAALAKLKARGIVLRAILVGYSSDMSRGDIERLARYYGVLEQLEIHERVPPEMVNRLINRTKINVLWSRREGFNRAIIEGMCSGVPCIVRDGFNYGYRYPYINDSTGRWVGEHELAERMLDLARNAAACRPRDWVLAKITPQIATHHLDEVLARYSQSVGEPWTQGRLAVKVTSLDRMKYWNADDETRFAGDYEWLRSMLRK